MIVSELDAKEYAGLFPRPLHAYNDVRFSLLNARKIDALHFLTVADGSHRIGITMGERDGRWISGFSAPFGGFDASRRIGSDIAAEMCISLTEFLKQFGNSVIVFPPEFFASSLGAMARYGLISAGWTDEVLLNNHFDLTEGEYMTILDSSSRNRLRKAASFGAEFFPCGLDRAYAVIRENRAMRGYPLAMSLDEVEATAPLTHTRGFVVSAAGEDLAAAIVNDISSEVSQVVYWGNNALRPEIVAMKFLAARLYEFYRNEGKKILDVGPSGTWGELSPSLSSFKEHVGCRASLKHRFSLTTRS